MSDGGQKGLASKFIKDHGLIQVLNKTGFPPSEDLFVWDAETGDKVLNIFNHNSIPKTPDTFTDQGLKAIELFQRHLSILFQDPKDQKFFEGVMAHQIQYLAANSGLPRLFNQ